MTREQLRALRISGIDSNEFDETITINTKSGKIWIGDPCYAISDAVYDSIVNEEMWNRGFLSTNDNHFGLVHGTDNGDGCFGTFVVDSGTLCIMNGDNLDGDSISYGSIINVGAGEHTLSLEYINGFFTFYVDDKEVESIETNPENIDDYYGDYDISESEDEDEEDF